MFSDLSLRLQRGLPEYQFEGPVKPAVAQAESILSGLGNNRPPEPATEGGLRGFFSKATKPGGFFERLGTFGAELQDIDDGGNRVERRSASRLQQQQAQMTQQQLQMRRDAEARLRGALTPQAGAAGAQGGQAGAVPDLRALTPDLLAAQAAGVDISDYVSLLDKAGPNIQVANGVAYDTRGTAPGSRVGVDLTNVNGTLIDTQNAANANRFVPEVGEGQELVYDANGRPMIRNIAGSVDARAIQEAAVSGARSAAQAPYQFVQTEGPNGEKITAAASQLAGGMVRGQGTADRVLAQGRATNQIATEQAQNEQARTDRGNLPVLEEALTLLPNVITGAGANARLQFDRAKAALGDQEAAQRVAATETFQSTTGRAVLAVARQLGSGSGITNADREFAQKISGGEISLNEESIRRILQIEQQAIQRRARERQGSSQPDRSALEAEARRRGLIR